MPVIEVQCRRVCLADGLSLTTEAYVPFVKPLDYEFGLNRRGWYRCFCVITRGGAPWVYVSPRDESIDIQLVPAELFECSWRQLPEDWGIRLRPEGTVELLPRQLSRIDRWYERYLDDDPSVIQVLRDIVG